MLGTPRSCSIGRGPDRLPTVCCSQQMQPCPWGAALPFHHLSYFIISSQENNPLSKGGSHENLLLLCQIKARPGRWCRVGAARELRHYGGLVEVSCGQGIRAAQRRAESHARRAAQPSSKLLHGSLAPECSRVPRSASVQQINTNRHGAGAGHRHRLAH